MLAATHLRLSFFSLRAITTTIKLAETNQDYRNSELRNHLREEWAIRFGD
jgi:hypothetical protein